MANSLKFEVLHTTESGEPTATYKMIPLSPTLTAGEVEQILRNKMEQVSKEDFSLYRLYKVTPQMLLVEPTTLIQHVVNSYQTVQFIFQTPLIDENNITHKPPPPKETHPDDIMKEGPLQIHKKGEMSSSWTKKYVVVNRKTILIYKSAPKEGSFANIDDNKKDKKKTQAQEKIEFNCVLSMRPAPKHGDNCFVIQFSPNEQRWTFKAANGDSAREWLHVIQSVGVFDADYLRNDEVHDLCDELAEHSTVEKRDKLPDKSDTLVKRKVDEGGEKLEDEDKVQRKLEKEWDLAQYQQTK